MAGDWIKMEHVTPDKPEIVRMAGILNIDQDAVFGKCFRIWVWADQQTINGNDLNVTHSFLDRLSNCPGFSSALAEVGWLKTRNGKISIPNFDRHNGQTAKNRALTKDRVEKLRNDQNVTQSLPEKRREEIEKIKNQKRVRAVLAHVDPGNLPPAKNDPPNISETLATAQKAKQFEFLSDGTYPYLLAPEFSTDWAAWLDMRRKLRWDNGPRALVLALNKLHTWPLEKAVLSLQLSIERSYRGIFEPKEDFNGGRNDSSNRRGSENSFGKKEGAGIGSAAHAKAAREFPERLSL